MSRILVIDDSELISKLLKEALHEAGFEAATAMDANEGYTTALDFHPDLILLDVQLPDVQGFDLIRVIKNREELSHIPIIMITGTHHHTDHKVKAFQAGADDYVLKPFEMPELIERIKAVLRRTETAPTKAPKILPLENPAIPPFMNGGDIETHAPSLAQTVYKAFVSPSSLSPYALPPMTLLFLSALLGLALGGWVLSAGSTVKPALIGLGTAGFWGLCVSFLVMVCSIMGVSLTWKEGARVICLAGLPLLLKLLGGVVMTIATSLTPFYFTASPALFLKASPEWLERLDVFELWMIWLIWTLVRQCRGSSKEKAWVAAAVVWPVVAYWQSLWKH